MAATLQQQPPPANLYHLTQALLRNDDRIYPGSWGRLIEGFGPGHNRYVYEYILEHIRAAEFPDKPTRMRACYGFENAGFAMNWKRGNAQEYLYSVQLADPSLPFHRGDMSLIDAMSTYRRFDGVEECARRYWRGEVQQGSGAIEWVLASGLVVASRLTQIPADQLAPKAAAAAA